MNRPVKGFSTVTPGNDAPFFAIHIEEGEKSYTKGLMGPLLDYEIQHMEGRPADPAWGTMALTTNAKTGVTYRTSSIHNAWSNGILDFWDDFSDDGKLVEKSEQIDHDPMASLAVQQEIPANGKKEFQFFLTWHFPNRQGWANEVVGNYYTTQYNNVWDVITKAYQRLEELEDKTLEFVNAFLYTDFTEVVKEAALFNLSTLRSQTVMHGER